MHACDTPCGGEVMQGDKAEELYIYNKQASNMLLFASVLLAQNRCEPWLFTH